MTKMLHKVCIDCNKSLPATSEYFHVAKKGKYGIQTRCKTCRSIHAGHKPKSRIKAQDGYKICNRCGEEKLATTKYYGRHSHFKDGLRAICKSCESNPPKLSLEIMYPSGMKICSNGINCKSLNGALQPVTAEHFAINKRSIDGLSPICKTCKSEVARIYYANNDELVKSNVRKRYERNPDLVKAYVKEWANSNRNSVRIYSTKRRARVRNLPNELTLLEWESCLSYWENKCCYCGCQQGLWNPITADHFIPVVKDGGTVVVNMLPACRSCNSSKSDSDPIDWLNRKLGKRKAKAKLKEIMAYFEKVRTT